MITLHLNINHLPRLSKSFIIFRSFKHGRQLFDKFPEPKLVSTHHTMLACLHRNRQIEALQIFKNDLQIGISSIDEVSVAIALKSCCGSPNFGSQIHGFAITSGFISYITVSNSLMNMYSRSSQFAKALCIFENLNSPDIVSWNTVLSGFENGGEAFDFARRMNSNKVSFDSITYTTVLSHCADYENLEFGIQLHSNILKSQLDKELFIANALITMYSKSGKIIESERVFKEMEIKDLVSWNAMISGYSQEGSYGLKAISCFLHMVRKGMKIDHVSFTSAVSACGHERCLKLGSQIHGLTVKKGYSSHVSVCNVLMSMYSKCDHINDSKLVFGEIKDRNVVSWTTMISIDEENAMFLFNNMRRDDVYPNHVTFVGLIHALTTKKHVQEGRTVHGFCIKTSFLSEINVANSFITLYAKFNSIAETEKAFNEIGYKEIVSWNALISGYAQNGQCQEALHSYSAALAESKPNQYTFGSVMSAVGASESVSLRHGQRFHAHLIKVGFDADPIMSGGVLDMYAKRGSITESRRVFDEMPEQTQISWTAIISAYARHGDYEMVMSLFEEMERECVAPDSITFLSVLTACGRKGMVEKGREIFGSMVKTYSIEPSPEHYSCMVDMLGRVGRLEEAEEFVRQIPGGPGVSVLQSLLGACKIHGDVERGKRAAEALLEKQPEESGGYVLISNLYAERGEWEKVAKIRRGMRDRGVKKEVGFSWVDAGGSEGSFLLHGFSSDDKSHRRSEEIYEMVEQLGSEMKFLQRKFGTPDLIAGNLI